MKNLKMKFGKFAISAKQVKKIKGGNPNCYYYVCKRTSAFEYLQPVGLDAECCQD
ncbi:hypothetical protein WAF17_08785 [Bernardetia sp. ABR2-2B]|uniref:hypothetical protein n=1 Tax=Bernardetia sp. ABR2-2B TaxID=3127472 RepID=UPI0030D2654A